MFIQLFFSTAQAYTINESPDKCHTLVTIVMQQPLTQTQNQWIWWLVMWVNNINYWWTCQKYTCSWLILAFGTVFSPHVGLAETSADDFKFGYVLWYSGFALSINVSVNQSIIPISILNDLKCLLPLQILENCPLSEALLCWNIASPIWLQNENCTSCQFS